MLTLSLCIINTMLLELKAQNVVNTSGGNASGLDGSVSYSIGQIIYSQSNGANGSVSEGVQQAFEISTIIGIENAPEINLSFFAFPNPTTSSLTLDIGNYPNSNLSYQFFNLNGSLLEMNLVVLNQTIINTSNYAQGVYFLKIIENGKELKTFKIVKN